MAEVAKGINPQITPEEVTQEVKEATAEVVEKLRAHKEPQLVSLRETISSEGFDDKRGWRRIMALWGSTNSPFYR
jgi:DNA-directed RNA polymerase specialized sigma subunit